mmetsp:Transcript_15117/g.34709  ORF Transcript_15117/g.34709 Transcript_15117/m.34709 type:complete len:284 (-) Transcript_15117:66-917(-)
MPVPWQLSQTTTPRPSHVMHTFSVACAGWLRVENRLAVHERVFSALYQTLGLASSTPQKWQEPRLNRRHEHELDLWADPQGADLQLGAFDASTLLALGTTYTSLRHRLEGHSHSFTNLDRVRLEDLLIHDHLLGPARPILDGHDVARLVGRPARLLNPLDQAGERVDARAAANGAGHDLLSLAFDAHLLIRPVVIRDACILGERNQPNACRSAPECSDRADDGVDRVVIACCPRIHHLQCRGARCAFHPSVSAHWHRRRHQRTHLTQHQHQHEHTEERSLVRS